MLRDVLEPDSAGGSIPIGELKRDDDVELQEARSCGLQNRGSAVLSFDAVEDVCERARTTLVIHPAVRRAVRGYEESFYIGLRCFLRGETDGLYFLPLKAGGYVRLLFSRRLSPGGYMIVRVAPVSAEALQRIKSDLGGAGRPI